MKTIHDIYLLIWYSCGEIKCDIVAENPCCDAHQLAVEMVLRGEY